MVWRGGWGLLEFLFWYVDGWGGLWSLFGTFGVEDLCVCDFFFFFGGNLRVIWLRILFWPFIW